MELRKIEEQIFHDELRKGSFGQRWSPELEKIINSNPLWTNMKYYSIERKSRSMVLDWLKENCQGKRVLDYCCGNGEDAIFITKSGAQEVIGIDISKRSIENCKEKAKIESVENNTSFLVMDAETLEFNSDSFDVISEYGALHHLKLDKAYSELARVLKKNGKVICNEALGHNPIIHLYRKMTPHLRTKWEIEHILCKRDLQIARRYFNNIETRFFHLSALGVVSFRNFPGFNLLLSFFEYIDEFLLRLPFIKWQAWQIVFILSQPNKSDTIQQEEGSDEQNSRNRG